MEIRFRNWLITGGCGFIGTSLIKELMEISDKSINIRVLDNLSVGKEEDLKEVADFKVVKPEELIGSPEGVELLIGDIRDPKTCNIATKGVDVVIHLAANTGVEPSVKNPRMDMETNVVGTFNLLEVSVKNKVKKFVFASSNAPLGKVEPPVNEEKAPKPLSPYGASKLGGEGYCSAFYNTFGLETVVLRFGNVYGPRSKHKNSVVAKFIKRALEDLPLEIYGDGTQTRDFIYIKDLVNAIILASNSNVGGEIFQIATYKETTVQEIAEKIKKLIKEKLGKDVSIVYSNPRIGDMKRNYSDISKAKKMLGYEPKYDLEKGLEETLEYFLEGLK